MIHVGENDQGSTVEMEVGQEMELVLPENRTTGYHWYLERQGASVVTLIDESFIPPTGQVGSGGHHRWVFRADQPGVGNMELVYRRSWESTVGRRLTFSIAVRP